MRLVQVRSCFARPPLSIADSHMVPRYVVLLQRLYVTIENRIGRQHVSETSERSSNNSIHGLRHGIVFNSSLQLENFTVNNWR